MSVVRFRRLIPVLIMLMLPGFCLAWFNPQWSSRKQIALDTSASGADIHESLRDFPLLIRLHAGNFSYFSDLAENGRDVRLLKDDSNPLFFQLEQIDPLNEMGLVWVRLPQVGGEVENAGFWLYYGNVNAAAVTDDKHLYDAAQSLVFHFQPNEVLPQDATAYQSHALESHAQILTTGWIGAAAQFNGSGPIVVNPAPQLAISSKKGWTFSSWVKIDQPQAAAKLLTALQGNSGLALSIQGSALVAGLQSPAGNVQLPAVNLQLNHWHFLALVMTADHLQLYLDDAVVGSAAVSVVDIEPTLRFGEGFTGFLDEVQIAATARSADWLKLAFRSQSPDFSVLNFGQDETNSDSDTHFRVIIENVTTDGWLIIGLTGLMLVVAVRVIIAKTFMVNRMQRADALFLANYRSLPVSAFEQFNVADSDLFGLFSIILADSERFADSPSFRLFQMTLTEVEKISAIRRQQIGNEFWSYLRVQLNSRIVAESRGLNHNLVLLTIAIAGGPFLGLLGTVVGVMITFADIAASGDVNINSIAPGISAALLATVAGLAVAIPALFAYNYLLSRIKDISSAMRVFADEFLALLAMRLACKEEGR
jgi:biopolymer transport protein ExbB